MSPETRERFAVLVERQLAGLPTPTETEELSRLLGNSEEALQLYLRAVEFHLDLGAVIVGKIQAPPPTEAGPGSVPEAGASTTASGAGISSAGQPGESAGEKRLPWWKVRYASGAVAAGFLLVGGLFAAWWGGMTAGTRTSEIPELVKSAPVPPATVRSTGNAIPISAAPVLSAAPVGPLAFAPDSLRALQARFDALAPGYKGFIPPEELRRFEDLMVQKAGSAADVQFLNDRFVENYLPRFEAEQAQFKSKILELEGRFKEPSSIDVVYFNDGRKIEGRVVEDNQLHVKLKSRFGVVMIPRADVMRIETGRGAAMEFPDKLKAAGTGIPQLVLLLDWCRDKGLRLEQEYIAYRILMIDAGHERSRRELGIPRPALTRILNPLVDPVVFEGGVLKSPLSADAARGLKDKLLKDGYALMDGKWFGTKERTISVPGLFKYQGQADQPVQISSATAPLSHDEETIFKMVLDAASGSFSEQPEVRLLRRFYAPSLGVMQTAPLKGGGYTVPADTVETRYQLRVDNGSPGTGAPTQGEVLISVPLGVPILEASVMTLAEVKGGGSLTVYLVNADGSRTKLYACSGKEDGTHKLPDSVKGRTQVDLAVVISAPAAYSTKVERRMVRPVKKNNNRVIEQGIVVVHHRLIPEYQAVLFPSTPNTVEVFRLKVQVAEAMPHLDKLFEHCPDLLK